MKKKILIILFVALSIGASAQKSTQYTVNVSMSTVKWSGKKIVGGETAGTIGVSQGTIAVSQDKLIGGNVILNTKSIASETASSRLIAHLKNEDFFDVEKFPTASFTVTDVKAEKNGVNIMGKITIKGITQTISFPATVINGKELIEVKAVGVKIDRTKFGVQYNSGSFFSDLGNKAIEDHFVLDISIVAQKK